MGRSQRRIHEAPASQSRDMHSCYGPSDQGGLMPADVDCDARTDILSGNYWIQCPAEFNLLGGFSRLHRIEGSENFDPVEVRRPSGAVEPSRLSWWENR
jgi:hypothetical protein